LKAKITIRLSRGGAKKQPFYHIVATDSRSRRDGRYIERLGFFNPVARSTAEPVRLDLERVDYWVGHGAQMSDRVKKIVKTYRKHGADDPNANKREERKAARKAKARADAASAAAVEEEATAEPEEAAADAAAESVAEEAPAAEAEAKEPETKDDAKGAAEEGSE